MAPLDEDVRYQELCAQAIMAVDRCHPVLPCQGVRYQVGTMVSRPVRALVGIVHRVQSTACLSLGFLCSCSNPLSTEEASNECSQQDQTNALPPIICFLFVTASLPFFPVDEPDRKGRPSYVTACLFPKAFPTCGHVSEQVLVGRDQAAPSSVPLVTHADPLCKPWWCLTSTSNALQDCRGSRYSSSKWCGVPAATSHCPPAEHRANVLQVPMLSHGVSSLVHPSGCLAGTPHPTSHLRRRRSKRGLGRPNRQSRARWYQGSPTRRSVP